MFEGVEQETITSASLLARRWYDRQTIDAVLTAGRVFQLDPNIAIRGVFMSDRQTESRAIRESRPSVRVEYVLGDEWGMQIDNARESVEQLGQAVNQLRQNFESNINARFNEQPAGFFVNSWSEQQGPRSVWGAGGGSTVSVRGNDGAEAVVGVGGGGSAARSR